MNLPLLTAYATEKNQLDRFETAIKRLQDSFAAQHIWNVDYVDAKEKLTRITEEAMHQRATAWLYANPDRKNLPPDDVRWSVYYTPSFLNTPGAYKKVVKYVGKGEVPEFDQAVEVIRECAQLAELVKSVKPFIEKGRKPSENPIEVDYTNTGICSVCGKRHKLDIGGYLVAHGYTLPRNWGGRSGICSGAGHKAWELSPEGAENYIRGMQNVFKQTTESLAKLQSGQVTKLNDSVRVRRGFGEYVHEKVTYEKGTPEFDKLLKVNIGNAEQQIRFLQQDIQTFTARVEGWKPEPLKYGGAETQERWKSRLLQKNQ